MKKIKITHDCLVKGQHTPAGTELNVDIVLAQQLLDAGVATEIKPGKVVNQTADKQVETRDPAAETRDPEPAPAKPATKRAKAKADAPAAESAPTPAADPEPATEPAPAADTPAE